MNVRYRVELSQAERDELTALVSGGKHPARKIKRAQILLAADAGARGEGIALSVAVGGSTVYRTNSRLARRSADRQSFDAIHSSIVTPVPWYGVKLLRRGRSCT